MTEATERGQFADQLLTLIKKRRAIRTYTVEPISNDILRAITEAGRFATSGGNRYPNKFLVVTDPGLIKLVRSVSPGMLGMPTAIVLIMLDGHMTGADSMEIENDRALPIDVGTAAMNMMVMAQAHGIGTCPVTSFSRAGVSAMIGLPDHLSPEFMIVMGHPAPAPRVTRADAPKPLTARDITYWNRPGNHDPDA